MRDYAEDRKSNRIRVILSLVVILAFTVVYSSFIYSRFRAAGSLEAQISAVNAAIKNQNALADELERERHFYESDEFIIKVARERLGLIFKDEVIFKRKP